MTLALLCFKHHNQASVTGNIGRKLSPGLIRKYRDEHYGKIVEERKISRIPFNHPVDQLTEELLLTTTKNALIILELESVREAYFNAGWEEKGEILKRIERYANHSNPRLALEIFDFLGLISIHTQGEMTFKVASNIMSLVIDFYPSYLPYGDQLSEITHNAIEIGDNIVYDALIHLSDFKIAMYGLTIWKYIHNVGTRKKIPELTNSIKAVYKELEETLKRPERNDLENAMILVKTFKEDLKTLDLSFPILPKHLMELVHNR